MRVNKTRKYRFKVEWKEYDTDMVVFSTELHDTAAYRLSDAANRISSREYDELVDSMEDAVFQEMSVENVFFASKEQAVRHLERYSGFVVELWVSHGELGYPETVRAEVESLDEGGTLFLLKAPSSKAVVRMTYPTIAVL